MPLTGWGRTRVSRCTIVDPAADLFSVNALSPHGSGLIVHAGGRSYGDCALNSGGDVMLTGGRNRILSWDEATCIAEVEPGVTFAQMLAEFLPRGFMVPVTPGTGFATMGGAVANDVHGKNHEVAGSFCQHVTSLDLVTPDGTMHKLTPGDELFAATAGGIGLTGIITRLALRLRRASGAAMRVRSDRYGDLEGLLAAMEAASGATHSVAWIDGTAKGARLGRGILETAEEEAGARPPPPGRRATIPFDFPRAVLNPWSVRLFNEAYFRHVPKAGASTCVHVARFLYPLDRVLRWNRIYGKQGFYQFQCVLPFAHGAEGLRTILEIVARSGQASFLSVLKRLGAGSAGYLSFPQPGYTLALDFPARDETPALYARLAEQVLRFGGRIYLGKDALLSVEQFRAMYPQWEAFAAILARVDPERLMQSDMRRRLGL